MTISSIMTSSLSALQANQAALRNTSTNVSNVNTEGYTRLDTSFSSRAAQGGTYGVEVDVRRAANTYLAAAEMRGAANVGSSEILADFMDRAQSYLGDPSNGASVFAAFDGVLDAFGELALDPAGSLRQGDVISNLTTLTEQLNRTSVELTALQDEADGRLRASLDEANGLMATIASLNASIQQARISGGDSSQAETEQSRMIDRLSQIIDIRIEERSLGGLNIRTTDGFMLVDNEAAKLSMEAVTGIQQYARVMVSQPHSSATIELESHIGGGEIHGFLKARDVELADLSASFGEYASGLIEALNAAHNEGASVPAPNTLTGVNTGLLGADQHNLTGIAHVGVTDASGVLVANLAVDFTSGDITDPAGNLVASFGANATIAAMATTLNGALGGNASVSFADGKLTMAATTSTNGIVIGQDETTPSDRAGKGFSHAFGLNNIVGKATPTSYATGLSLSDPAGFSAGENISFALKNADGGVINQVNVEISAATVTVGDFLSEINATLVGFGAVSLDGQGRLSFKSQGVSGAARLDVVSDTTQRGTTGLSASQIFGLGDRLSALRAQGVSVRRDIAVDYSRIAAAKPDLAGEPVGTLVLASGDGAGAIGLEEAGERIVRFGAAGAMGEQSTSVNDYAARFAGVAGARATATDSAAISARAIHEEVGLRRQSSEGVNIDEELVKMTQYQQAYSAASRMIQAAQDLYDTLLSIV